MIMLIMFIVSDDLFTLECSFLESCGEVWIQEFMCRLHIHTSSWILMFKLFGILEAPLLKFLVLEPVYPRRHVRI